MRNRAAVAIGQRKPTPTGAARNFPCWRIKYKLPPLVLIWDLILSIGPGMSHDLQGPRVHPDAGRAGRLEMAVPDRRQGDLGQDRSQAQFACDPAHSAADRPRAEEG